MDGALHAVFFEGKWFVARALGPAPYRASYAVIDLPEDASVDQMQVAVLRTVWVDGQDQFEREEEAIQHAVQSARNAIVARRDSAI